MKLNPTLKVLTVLSMTFLAACSPENKSTLLLPIMGEKKVVNQDTVYHRISDFRLINQSGDTVSQKNTEGKIYVANFFFATCQSICPEMSSQLKLVQAAFAGDDSILILSHSVNPMHDTVEVLSAYAAVYGAQKNKWHLLTGDKKQIYELAKTSYLVNALEDDGSPEGFLHSELFLLIDTKGRIRGMYDGTYAPDVQKLIKDIRLLKQEPL
jgi:protein SCO1